MRTTKFSCLGAAALLSGCVIDPSMFPDYPASGGNNNDEQVQQQSAPSRSLVNRMRYTSMLGAGQISYFRTTNSPHVRSDKTRFCFQNATGQPKKMIWTKGEDSVGNLIVPKNGDRSCANRKLSQRVEFTFLDRNLPVKNSGMNIGGVGGTLIEFIWVED